MRRSAVSSFAASLVDVSPPCAPEPASSAIAAVASRASLAAASLAAAREALRSCRRCLRALRLSRKSSRGSVAVLSYFYIPLLFLWKAAFLGESPDAFGARSWRDGRK